MSVFHNPMIHYIMFNAKQIKPMFDRVLLRPMSESTTSHGIIVPHNTSERSQIMSVVSIGDGTDEDGITKQMNIKLGDKVLVAKYAGTEVLLGTEKFLLVKQCEILATLKED